MGFAGHAFVDWDDTVAENIRYFNEVESQNAELIARWTGADVQAVRHRGAELDVAVARRIGLVRESLGTAWTECYREFCAAQGVAVDKAVEAELWKLCQIPYETKQELLPGAELALSWLNRNRYEVTIWTAGDLGVQRRKVRDSGLEHLIHRVEVVLDKTAERLSQALGDRDRSRCFVVGNSAHSDIRPALALGLPAVHIPVETWAYDKSQLDHSHPNYHRIAGIGHLPQWLAGRASKEALA